jgi:hypothetical protein
MYDGFTYFAWLVLAILSLVAVAIIVALGSLPKKIATGRNHPQVDAINACSWIGLALGGVGWPIAFVWAFLKSGPAGYDAGQPNGNPSSHEVEQLKMRIAELESQLKTETNVKT